MAPKYPWQRVDGSPTTPSTSDTSRTRDAGSNGGAARSVVVSASGREAFSPNANNTTTAGSGLAPNSSPQLRIRNSPRTGNAAGGGGALTNQRDSYPSPSARAGINANGVRTPGRNTAGNSAGPGAGGSAGGSGSGAGSRVRTIFGRRRKDSDASVDTAIAAVSKSGLDVSVSPAGTPLGAGGKSGGWRQVPVDSPGSSNAGSPAAAKGHRAGNGGSGSGLGAGAGAGVAVKRFDARGYPTRDDLHTVSGGPNGAEDSPSKTTLLRSRGSEDDLSVRSVDSTGAAVGGSKGSGAGGLFGLLSGVGSPAKKGAADGNAGTTAKGKKVGSGEGQSAAARYALTSRQSYLNGNGSSGPSAGATTTSAPSGSNGNLYPPTLTNYSLSSPSYSPSEVGHGSGSGYANGSGYGPSASSSSHGAGVGVSGGRADYFAATASVLGGYENVRTPSDDEGLSGFPSGQGTAKKGRGRSGTGSGSASSSLYEGRTGPGWDRYEPSHYDGYGYAKSITGTMRTHRTQRSAGSEVTMGSRAHLGRYDALQDQFARDRGKAGKQGPGEDGNWEEGYEYGVGGLKDDYGAFSVGSRGGKKHLGHVFALPPDPTAWTYLGPEADDDLHDPDSKPRGRTGFMGSMFTMRGAGNVGCLAFMLVVLVGMFAVYPITSQFLTKVQTTAGAYNLGGINATGQIPDVGPFQLIDHDTPQSAYTHTSFETGETWDLVFSDEFNRDGRTFWPGDDPFWEAQDLHYWQTNNKEWYHPTMVTTVGGSLRITLTNEKMNGLNYTGGMINSWNRFCFTGGYVEASVSLPGKNNVYGLWPAIWTLGNLGRAGYGGTLDGVWPYSYDSCDLGTLHNQTLNGEPVLEEGAGDKNNFDHLSYLPGQRLSRCTCPDDPTHPGPKHPDGTWVGRAAPEIDMFEAVIDSTTMLGEVSQSAQWAPFDPYYQFNNASANFEIYNDTMTYINPWLGSVWQQATTALSYTDPNCYTAETGCYSKYGFEYAPGNSGYVTWVSDNRLAWTVRGAAMGANAVSMVSERPVPQEPMYLLLNLGLSENFGPVDYEGLEPLFPVHMDVDYIRVYQDPNQHNIGCDPDDFPTQAYINRFIDVYNNPNITVMGQIDNFTVPRNSLIDTC